LWKVVCVDARSLRNKIVQVLIQSEELSPMLFDIDSDPITQSPAISVICQGDDNAVTDRFMLLFFKTDAEA
jgi:hypothetical protein